MKIDLSELTIKKANELLNSGDISAGELLEFYLENIKKHDSNVNAFLEVFDESAFEQAENVDKKIKDGGQVPLLAGIPFAIKDNILIKNKKCSSASKILENFVAPYDATVIEKLKRQGAVFVGRTNMDEFAMGASTENSAYGPTKNPYDQERVPGGSSGGSAAAVAQQECMVSLGSDTGGSIRQPAAFCGVVGLKPTYGSVSRNGLMSLASSLDQIGPIAKTVEDTEIIFDAIKGQDTLDFTSMESNIQHSTFNIQNSVVGVPKESFDLQGENEGLSPGIIKNTKESIKKLESLGFKIKQTEIDSLKRVVEAYYTIMPAEAASNLARYDGIRYGFSENGDTLLDVYKNSKGKGFGSETKRRILLGNYVLSSGFYDAYYGTAQKAREFMKYDLKNRVFSDVDFILSPTTPTPAFKIGEKTSDPVEMYLADIFTAYANLTGIPAISLPNGFEEKLPTGLQLMAPWFEEKRLFDIGKKLEK